jgi:hypothetical protein
MNFEKPPTASVSERRSNHIQAAYVSAAVTIAKGGSAWRAELLLVNEGIPKSVIDRVLRENGPRRPTAHEERLSVLNEKIHASQDRNREE